MNKKAYSTIGLNARRNAQIGIKMDDCCKTKHREESEIKDLTNRLNRIEGQVRGIRSMVEKDAYCIDILTQVSAASAALTAFSKLLLNNHVRTCVVEDIRDGKDDKVEELLQTIQKFMK